MGYTSESIKIIVATSSHNSDQDKIDRKLWEKLQKKIEKEIQKEKYKSITPMIV